GETREVDELHLKGHKLITGSDEAKSKAPGISIIEKILADKIPAIKKQMPDFTIETINDLEEAEKAAKKPRAGLLTAISEERLRRAADTSKADLETFISTLDGMSDEELVDEGSKFAGDESKAAYLDAVNDELAKRKGEGEQSELAQFAVTLVDMSNEDLQASKELYSEKPEDEAYLQAVNTEIENRAQA
ncbi:MAG: hypothetical protein OQK69_08640, partial [Gammaproteobacteria bacterium]|nr:hypothetical protein [Gammaproteobacteria bacterium]